MLLVVTFVLSQLLSQSVLLGQVFSHVLILHVLIVQSLLYVQGITDIGSMEGLLHIHVTLMVFDSVSIRESLRISVAPHSHARLNRTLNSWPETRYVRNNLMF